MEIKDVTEQTTYEDNDVLIGQEIAGGVASNFRATFANIASYLFKKKTGFFNYNDLATATVAFTHDGSSGFLPLPNDGAGTLTTVVYAPTGMTTLWDVVGNQLNFTQLSIGDMVTLRVDLEVTTTTNNQWVELRVEFDIGGTPFPLTFAQSIPKTSGTYSIVKSIPFFIGNAGVRDNPSEIQIDSDAPCNVKVNGWYATVARR